MLAQGINPKIVSERLGHHSTAFTLDTYAHVIPGMQRTAAQQVTDTILNPTPASHSRPDLDLA